jgi:flagellar P-ring protein precursor FlgI
MTKNALSILFLLAALLTDFSAARAQSPFTEPTVNRPQRSEDPVRAKRLARAPTLNPTAAPNQQFPGIVAGPEVRVRIKDITSVEGHRANRVTGIGLVTGLKGTGGKSLLTQDLARNMLRNFDILARNIPSGSQSVVAVTAEIPPFVRAGEKVTATVSIFDDAIGLYGGELHTTPLRGFDNQVYAVAGGALVLGGFSAGGEGASVSKNHDTTGRVQATVEVGIQDGPAFPHRGFRLLLSNKDYATAYRIATEINRYFPGHSRARDQGSVDVLFPRTFQQNKIDFVVMVNNLRVQPDIPARVVINQKTGTIVVGQNVRLSRIMFANDNLIITTSETPIASQPAPFSDGQTVVLPRTQVTATETGGRYNILNQQTTVGELATALNVLGVSPQDLIGIFQSIQASGALQAKLVIE